MTKTPRTDEFERADCCDLEHALDFARELERELAEYKRGYVSADQHNKLAAELHAIKTDWMVAERSVNRVLQLLPKRDTDSWEDAVNGWLKETAELKAERDRR